MSTSPSFPVGQAPWETTAQPTQPSSFAVGQAPWDTSTAPTPTPQAPDTTKASQSTFPAPTNQQVNTPSDILSIAARTLGNIPSSAYNFGKGVVNFFNPLNTIKTVAQLPAAASEAVKAQGGVVPAVEATAAAIPGEAYKALVPQFIQHIFSGDLGKASSTIQNDPVGQILPLILVARSAADAAGQGAQFDQAISSIASPVTKPVGALASKAGDAAGNLAAQILGVSTGTGASSVKQAFNGSPAFVNAMRGNTTPEDVVQTAQDAVQNIVDQRRADYVSQLKNIGDNTKSLDISPVIETLYRQLSNFGVKINDDGTLDFSRSSIANNGSARADVQGVYDTLKTWGLKEGDRTPIGLDTLKKQLADFYSPSGSARAFVQAVKAPLTSVLNDQVPGYSDMTSGYSKASQLLDEIKSATGAGGNAKVDTVFTKLTTALKADKELRLQVLQQMQSQGAQPDLMDQIAGTNMQSYLPKGMVGKFTDVGAAWGILMHYFNPQYIPMLLSTSPRLVGEFVHALGMGTKSANAVMNAVNQFGGKVPNVAGIVPQQNPQQETPKMQAQ